MSAERRAALLVVIAACGFGTISVGTALAARAGVTLPTLMAWRFAFATPLLVLAAGGPTRLRMPPRRALALLAAGGTGQVAVTWLSLSALEWIPAAAVGFLFYTFPAWVALFAAVTGLERLTLLRVGALTLALGGIALTVGSPWHAALPWAGVWRALAAAFVYALYIPLLHWLRGPFDAAAASTWVIAGAAATFLLLAGASGALFAGMTLGAWGIALVLAVFSTVVAFIAFLRGLAGLGPVRAAIVSTVEPFWTTLLAAIVLAQPIGLGTIAGGSCIVGAIVLLQRAPPTHSARPRTP